MVEVSEDSESTIAGFRELGAPIVLACYRDTLQWWRQSSDRPQLVQSLSYEKIDSFFEQHRVEFAPDAVYRAKTWGRFDKHHQLTFVDVGLMPVVERETGEALGRLIERKVSSLTSAMEWKLLDNEKGKEKGKWLLQSVFWLVAAKILADKRVGTFAGLDLTNVDAAFTQVAAHYGTESTVRITNQKQREALHACAADIARFSDLSHVSTESLAYVYENTLISKKTRRDLGTHSTPPCLVDYVVGKLADWIADIPADRRHVFEPACGHGAFLVSATRLLRELRLEANPNETPKRRHKYLQRRLHGCEIDAFALEIARLSLTLADIPNPDGWDLQPADMFLGDFLERQSREAMILLANPPFQSFTERERSEYVKRGVSLQLQNKTAEMLIRTLSHLSTGAVFGVVIPQGLLHSPNAAPLRQLIARRFEISEICLFADKLFRRSDAETAVLLGRKVARTPRRTHTLSYRRVREPDIEEFRKTYAVSSRCRVEQQRFAAGDGYDMRVPELEEIWLWCRDYLTLDNVCETGQGLAFKGRDLPQGTITYQKRHFTGAARGFVHFDRNLEIHQLPREYWLNLSPDVVLHRRTGTTTNVPQVLLNYARVSRGPWRLKGLLDERGHAVTSRFLTVRPLNSAVPLEFFWALCNSPVANAFAYTQSSMKRDNLVGTMRRMPIPHSWEGGIRAVVQAARAYLGAVGDDPNSLFGQQPNPHSLSSLLLQVDAEVLRLYDLPPRLERELLDYFKGEKRQGVPFKFDRYYPPDFEPCFPLHEYLSDSFRQSTAGALRERHEDAVSPDISAAMHAAVEAFQE